MSGRHQARRRRSYGRRQHELRERHARLAGQPLVDDEPETLEPWHREHDEDVIPWRAGIVDPGSAVRRRETAA